jgi:hypothetical protein
MSISEPQLAAAKAEIQARIDSGTMYPPGLCRVLSGLRRRGPRFRALSLMVWHFELHSFGVYRLVRNSRRRSPGL